MSFFKLFLLYFSSSFSILSKSDLLRILDSFSNTLKESDCWHGVIRTHTSSKELLDEAFGNKKLTWGTVFELVIFSLQFICKTISYFLRIKSRDEMLLNPNSTLTSHFPDELSWKHAVLLNWIQQSDLTLFAKCREFKRFFAFSPFSKIGSDSSES